jgi:STE24 endopeptidase
VTLVLLLAVFAVLVATLTPWRYALGHIPGGQIAPDAARDFTPAQIARETAFHDAIRPWGLSWLFLDLAVAMLLGFTPIGRRLVGRLRRRRWLVQVLAATVGFTLVVTLVSLPFSAREHALLTQYGLTLQGWGGWFSDVVRGYLVNLVGTLLVLLVVMGLARKLPRRWWLAAAALGAALVFGGSFAYPYIVEPVFNNFHSLPAGSLRSALLAEAARDHQPLSDILVADASRRTTTENAYVSGFGASRRLVLYDTLIAQDSPQEIKVITAHELGHAKYDDVLMGTIEGAVAVAAGMCALFLLVGGQVADPRRVPLLLALYAVVTFAVSPLTNVISRHIEARADAHSLRLSHDPQTFIQAQRDLAVTGLDDLRPDQALYVLFFTHPSAPQRTAMARNYERQHALAG